METKKEELIRTIINGDTSSLEKTRDEHQGMIDDYQENGFGDVHPGNIESIKTGLHYTHGYTIGHLELLKQVNSLMGMSSEELKELIIANEKISKENEKHMNDVLGRIKNKK